MTEYIQKCLEHYKWPPIGRGSIKSDSCGVDLCLIFVSHLCFLLSTVPYILKDSIS